MTKRGRLEIIENILKFIQNSHNKIKQTPLLRKSNLSSARFKEYYTELLEKEFIKEEIESEKYIILTQKGIDFLEKYRTIVSFIDEFDL